MGVYRAAMWFAILCVTAVLPVRVDGRPARMDDADRIRIAEAKRLGLSLGERVWVGWNHAPFGLLLVTSEREFLVSHSNPSDDFTSLGYDSLLGSEIYTRDRVFDKNLLATFPAVGGVPTIVIGQAKNTEASHSTRWVITVLHEHFHQLQMSQWDYYPAVEALNLARYDSTGMWMLNYPFPYESEEVNDAFSAMCTRLQEAMQMRSPSGARRPVERYWLARNRFRRLLSRDDYAYFSFQVWQEGMARYTEYRLAKMAASVYRPSDAFRALPDFEPYDKVADELRAHVEAQLLRANLKKDGRTAFYYVGAAEAMILDVLFPGSYPGWHPFYFRHKFFTEKYFELAPR